MGMTASCADSAVLGLAVYRALSLLVSMASIVTDEEVFAQFKEGGMFSYKFNYLSFTLFRYL